MPNQIAITVAVLGALIGGIRVQPVSVYAQAELPEVASGSLTSRNLAFEGEEHRYLVYVPAGYQPGMPAGLVVAIPGSNTRPEAMLRVGFNELADKAGFIVAYANLERPTSPVWVEFISQLLDGLQSDFSLDPQRLYVTGFSRGSAVTHILACYLSDRLAAFAAVDGAPRRAGPNILDVRGTTFACEPPRAVPLLHFHGSESGQSPYSNARSVIEFWRDINECAAGPEMMVLEAEDERIIKEDYTGCRQGAQVTLYTIEGGVHAWPGAPRGAGDIGIGANEEEPASISIAATPIIWEFFQAHPMPR